MELTRASVKPGPSSAHIGSASQIAYGDPALPDAPAHTGAMITYCWRSKYGSSHDWVAGVPTATSKYAPLSLQRMLDAIPIASGGISPTPPPPWL
jgi:hypothetical protein